MMTKEEARDRVTEIRRRLDAVMRELSVPGVSSDDAAVLVDDAAFECFGLWTSLRRELEW